jgi:hypothetical protein
MTILWEFDERHPKQVSAYAFEGRPHVCSFLNSCLASMSRRENARAPISKKSRLFRIEMKLPRGRPCGYGQKM